MPRSTYRNRVFDARPDRIDYRDRPYNPILKSLPLEYPASSAIKEHLQEYTKSYKLILNQGQEGACTGFGLAAVINYLLWRDIVNPDSGRAVSKTVEKVSPRMLYHLAQIYDEWAGEDYEGSSCRGAMKGWHRHGVCSEVIWPYKAGNSNKYVKPKSNWQADAARRPLGAYYRINKDSIADMQAAIFEVGAIYCSSSVHEGWFLSKQKQLSVIPPKAKSAGGHAFAIVGYDSRGFIVQNSWGPEWGYLGFAILAYEDWVKHGTDAWVAVMGAPMEVIAPSRSRSSLSYADRAAGRAEWFWSPDKREPAFPYRNKAVQPLSESDAYEHTVVLGNDGAPIDRFIDTENNIDAVNEVSLDLPLKWLQENKKYKLAVYAHGGLNSEADSIKRIRVMAPYFRENGVYPLFITWRTGFGESIAGILEDAVNRFFMPAEGIPAAGIADLKRKIKDAKDRSIEVACEHLLVKPVWMQMKQNAAAALEPSGGLGLIARNLARLKGKIDKLEIHLVGHSAGSILHGYLLQALSKAKLDVRTFNLYAPACTVDFAIDKYVDAVDSKTLSWKNMFVDVLSSAREQSDTVGPYGKSLLYLVSRALEDVHKMPLLGMEAVWHPAVEGDDMWQDSKTKAVTQWRTYGPKIALQVHGRSKKEYKVWNGQEYIPLAHGSFDNDISVITATLERIIGGPLKAKIETLAGF